MPLLFRIAEIILYSLLNFLPYIVPALVPFRHKLRFSRTITAMLIGAMCVLQILFGMWASFLPGSWGGTISIISTVFYFALFFLAVDAHFGKKLFVLLAISNIASFITICAKYLEHLFFSDTVNIIYAWTHSLMMLIIQAILIPPLVLSMRGRVTHIMEMPRENFAWRYIWLIPATFYLVWYFHVYSYHGSSSDFASEGHNVIFLLIVDLGAYLVYYMVLRLILEQESNARLRESNHTLALQTLQFEYLQEHIAGARQAKHDIRHHISTMLAYLEKGNYDKLREYLNSYRKSLPDDSSIEFCKNYSINAILLYFAQLSKENGIDFSVRADIPEQIDIDEIDLSVLLGNLIENALEACINQTQGEKKIIIGATRDAGAFYFTVDNTFEGSIEKSKDGAFLSTKHKGNGIGTQSVQRITRLYNGICSFETQDGIFRASVMLKCTPKPDTTL